VTASLARAASGADTDNNSVDFTAGAPAPQNAASDTPPTGPTVGAVSDKAYPVDVAITPFTMTATGGTSPYTWSATGLPAGLALDPGTGEVSGTPTATGVSSVTVTVTDSTNATGQTTFSVTVSPAGALTPIADIQGTGSASPLAGNTVMTQGVVSAMYPTGGLNGMYIQTGGTGGAADATPGASDGIFVFGSNSMPAGIAVGDSVEVTGPVSEFAGLTEITPASGGVTELAEPLTAVTAWSAAYPTTDADREAHEGELIAPTDQFTVTNAYATNQYAEIGLATGDHPLVQPTEVVAPSDAGGLAVVKADNAARAVTLDDAASLNFLSAANQGTPLPWLTKASSVRVGASATFHQPVVLDFRNSTWKFQPTHRVTDQGTDVVTFSDTRTPNLQPSDVGGDLKLATFNVENYFDTTGQDYVSYGGTCSFYNDRSQTPIQNNTCTSPTGGSGPRGAATQVSFERQRAKIVTAINSLGADIVTLEEMENSTRIALTNSPLSERWRDEALANLVGALNAAAGPGTWALVASPTEATTSTNLSSQDVIRPAFIYKPATVRPVGMSDIYFGEPTDTAFTNAREPLAQVFKPKGHPNSDGFAVVVNHFKSKGDSSPPATGDNANNADTGAFNGDRTRQADALWKFANQFAADRGVARIFLTGDFNAYSMEDPVQLLESHGFQLVESTDTTDASYSFGGLSGSLDHVFANAAAMNMVSGADVWEINADEPIAYNYGRYNYNATEFFDSSVPFAASDHNPEVVGLDITGAADSHDIQILATNDFHGRLQNNTANTEAGAAVLAGAVKQLRAQNPDTVFAAAGDLIGASTFESFIADDKPTIDALNEAGLEVSAVGNHELDKGQDDLLNRVMAPYDAETNPAGGAGWQYIAANLRVQSTGDPLVPETWVKTMDGVEVGFVGAVTEDLPALVSPAGIEGIDVTDIATSVNTAAADLRTAGADIIVLLVHEGAPSSTCSAMDDDPTSSFGSIVTGVSADVDAIISGHTHLEYSCSFPVQQWVDESRAVTSRPVLSAGQYGMALDQLVYTVDSTGTITGLTQGNLDLKGSSAAFNFPADSATATIVADAVAAAATLGAQVLGQVAGPFNRAKLADGTTENRGGESTLGNLVAEAQRWATRNPESGSAQIAFMNPGGLRADMVGNNAGGYPADLTYKQAATVQPFANSLVNMDLTGAQIRTALEQQWQPAGASRPFLRLGSSTGFTYTYDPTKAAGSRVTGMWLDGTPIDLAGTYSVTVNSFLASGGDNFSVFGLGTSRQDTGRTDLQAMVDFMAEYATDAPLPVDYHQHSVGVKFPVDTPASYQPDGHVVFDVSSLAWATAADLKDTDLQVKLSDTVLGTFPVTNTIGTDVFDEYGTASVDVTLPHDVADGVATLTLLGATTGTTVPVSILVSEVPGDTSVAATGGSASYGEDVSIPVTVTPSSATGPVEVRDGDLLLGTATLSDGAASVLVPGGSLMPGTHELTVIYLGDHWNHSSSTTITMTISKLASTTTATVSPSVLKVKKDSATVAVTVSAPGNVVPQGEVGLYVGDALVTEATLVNGQANLTVGPYSTTGQRSFEVRYLGNAYVDGSSVTKTVTVVKQTPKLTVTRSPATIHARTTNPVLKVSLTALANPVTKGITLTVVT